MSDTYTVGRYLVVRLAELGLGHLFSIAGDYSIEWVNNYVEPSAIAVIPEVNELCAGYAADGYARFNGIGALCVTYSAGALSAVNAIAGSYVERVPVVLINGAPSIKQTLIFEQTGFSAHHFISGRQTDLQVFEPITAAAVRVDNPDLAPMLIDDALTRCITERRPVYIELVKDMVGQPCAAPSQALRAARSIPNPDGSVTNAVTQIATKLKSAKKPVIWVGVEIDRFGLQEPTQRLIAELGVPYVSEFLSKAVLPENDVYFAGVFDGLASSQPVQNLIRDADFILALGVWLTDLNSLGWSPEYDKTAFVSLDTVKCGTYFAAQVPLGDFIGELRTRGIDGIAWGLPARTRQTPGVDLEASITYQGFYDIIPDYIDRNTIIGADASLNYFGSMGLQVDVPGGFIVQSSYSSIGYIGPAATGACLAKRAREHRVMVFSGDGGFQMTAQCLSTQTRFGLNPIIFVINNGVYAVEQWLADARVFDPLQAQEFYKSCRLHVWNYCALANVFGCKGWRVATYVELKDAMVEALKIDDCPSIIEVVVDEKSIPENAKWKKD